MAVSSALPTPADVHVMVAGLPRSGKSTALNNVFDLELKAKPGARSVTELVTSIVVKKNGVTLKIIDTPGLNAMDLDQRPVMKEITKSGIEKDFILLLTLSVQGGTISNDYINIIKNLNCIFGSEIWEKCVLLLTFSDMARINDFNSDTEIEDYQQHLSSYCELLQKVLAKYEIKKTIRLFSEYKSQEQFLHETLDGIVAMPVARNPDVATELILPDLPWAHEHKWNDILLMELIKMKDTLNKKDSDCLKATIICLRFGLLYKEDMKFADAFIGAVKGAVAGGLRKPATGAVMGAAAGAIVGPASREIGVENTSIPQLVRAALHGMKPKKHT